MVVVVGFELGIVVGKTYFEAVRRSDQIRLFQAILRQDQKRYLYVCVLYKCVFAYLMLCGHVNILLRCTHKQLNHLNHHNSLP